MAVFSALSAFLYLFWTFCYYVAPTLCFLVERGRVFIQECVRAFVALWSQDVWSPDGRQFLTMWRVGTFGELVTVADGSAAQLHSSRVRALRREGKRAWWTPGGDVAKPRTPSCCDGKGHRKVRQEPRASGALRKRNAESFGTQGILPWMFGWRAARAWRRSERTGCRCHAEVRFRWIAVVRSARR